MACEVESEVESLLLDSVIRGYYIYKDVWASYIGEVLRFHHNVHNHHDPLAFWVRQPKAEMSTLLKYLNRDIG